MSDIFIVIRCGECQDESCIIGVDLVGFGNGFGFIFYEGRAEWEFRCFEQGVQ
jgi:hypothetical protein